MTFFPRRVHELKGLCCAVTGASDGLGVFIAHALAAEGAEKLVLGARRVEKLEEVKANLAERFPKAGLCNVLNLRGPGGVGGEGGRDSFDVDVCRWRCLRCSWTSPTARAAAIS